MGNRDRFGERVDDDPPASTARVTSVTSVTSLQTPRHCLICGTDLLPSNRTHCCAECRLTARNGAFDDEVWLPVIGFPGWELSDRGRVRDSATHQVREPDRSHRYPRINLNGRKRYVHVLMAETWLGPRPWGRLALHDDDDPGNTRIGNINWGTPAQNYQDAIRNGRIAVKGGD
jgi:hypothetical protein